METKRKRLVKEDKRLEEKTLFTIHGVREVDEVAPGGLLQSWG